MPITERTLQRWRKESLIQLQEIEEGSTRIIDKIGFTKELNQRVLRLTQELLDQHTLRKVKR